MNWLAQNWIWIVLAIGAVWLVRRGGLASCEMGGHAGHSHLGGTAGAASEGMRLGDGPMRNQGEVAGNGPQKAVDPVSGREVLASQAVTAAYQGRVFFFEGADTRQRFEAAPERYARNAAPAPQQHPRRGCVAVAVD
ncbi:MAG: hypothetical protein M3R43_09885 [Acidobacteriota bacterium]|nr:hypothetical protein [Acidobacteriota bacterium]